MKQNLKGIVATREAVMFKQIMKLLPNPNQVLAKAGDVKATLENIRADLHVKSCITQRKAGVLSQLWEVQIPNNEQGQHFDLVRKVFDDLKIHSIIKKMLNAPFYGYQPLEIYWREELINGQTYLVAKDIVAKPLDWFAFDEKGMLRLRTLSNHEGMFLNHRKFLITQHEESYENPYGEALLSDCLWPVVFKKAGVKWLMVFLEKFGIPHYIGKTDEQMGTENYDKFLDAVDELVQDAVAIIGKEDSLDIIHGTTTSSEAIYKFVLNFMNSEISKAILTETLTTEIGEKGSYAASKTHSLALQSVVDSDRAMVEEQFNLLIKYIIEVNFGVGYNLPKFIMYPQQDVDKPLAEVTDLLQKNKTLKFTKQFYINRFGFKEDEFEVLDTTVGMPGMPFDEGEPEEVPEDQDMVEEQVAMAVNDGELYFRDITQLVKNIINTSESFEEARGKMKNVLKGNVSDSIQQDMVKKLFASEILGRLSVQDELRNDK